MQEKYLRKTGWWILLAFSIAPIGFWLAILPLNLRFFDTASSIRSLGDISGLCGMTMFSLVMILSARLKFFEKFFKGLNEVYVAHHLFGALSFCLLLFHPLLLAYNYLLISFNSAALFFLPSANWAQNFGILGLFLMIITLVITFYTKLKYQIWKYTHKFLGVAFIFAFLHTIMVGADISASPPLRAYFIILGIISIAAYLYRVIFARVFVKTFSYTVKSITALPDKMYEIELMPTNKEINYSAGQFAFVRFYNQILPKEQHPFSISSAPGTPLRFIIKELGDYTKNISSLKEGDLVKVEGPFGCFDFRNFTSKKQVWVAGGVGVTPFLSMLRSLDSKDSDYNINLFYSARTSECLSCAQEIEVLTKNNKNAKPIFFSNDKQGFLTADFIKNNTPDFYSCDFLICGPPSMMSALKKQLREFGIHQNNIHTEEFSMY